MTVLSAGKKCTVKLSLRGNVLHFEQRAPIVGIFALFR